MIRVPGRSLEIPIPITRRDVPNVFLAALMIRHGADVRDLAGTVRAARFSRRPASTVTPDKPRYAPGEKAHLRLTARDYRGRPLRAELSVSIADAALNYIQKDYAPDIRAYFYGDRRQQNIDNEGSFANKLQLALGADGYGQDIHAPRPDDARRHGSAFPPGGRSTAPTTAVETDPLVVADQGGNVYLDASRVYYAQILDMGSVGGLTIKTAASPASSTVMNGSPGVGGGGNG